MQYHAYNWPSPRYYFANRNGEIEPAYMRLHARIQRGGGRGPNPPFKNTKHIGFLCNTCPDPVKNHKATKVSKEAKIRNRYNQVPKESQDVSPFPAGDHKAQINRRAQRHSKHKTEPKHKRSTKEVPPWNGQ